MKNYILVSQVPQNSLSKNPWKLIFRGRKLEALSAYNEETDMFQYETGKEALLVALRLQNFTKHTTVVVDPSLRQEEEIDNEKVIIGDGQLIMS